MRPSLIPRQAGMAESNSSWGKKEREYNPPRVYPVLEVRVGLNAQEAVIWTWASITSIKKGKAIHQVQKHH